MIMHQQLFLNKEVKNIEQKKSYYKAKIDLTVTSYII